MALEQLVSDYGAFGLFAGAGLEGETVAMLGGVLAHRGLLDFWTAVLAVAAGSFLTDQIFFLAGRRFRNSSWVRKLQAGPAGARPPDVPSSSRHLRVRLPFHLRVTRGKRRDDRNHWFSMGALFGAEWPCGAFVGNSIRGPRLSVR